ncbi:MAG: L,D-transpeptidase [Verrucomicrobia bacterium]|nr:L,D-transpeptidase [Verrucomicrobiota bacterium]MCF7708641.1 L,D-transpeptidase [Verrucomicrobiota bacterium]
MRKPGKKKKNRKLSRAGDLYYWVLTVIALTFLCWLGYEAMQIRPPMSAANGNGIYPVEAESNSKPVEVNTINGGSISQMTRESGVDENVSSTDMNLSRDGTALPEQRDTRAEVLRPVGTTFEAQLALDRQGLSPGSIDGVMGPQTAAAISAFQLKSGLAPSGTLNSRTRERLLISEPLYTNYVITPEDIGGLCDVPDTWLGKSQMEFLGYETVLEMVAEKFHADPDFIRSLNPDIDWKTPAPGARIKAPITSIPAAPVDPAFIKINLGRRQLRVYDDNTNLLAHFPCSIGASVEKRPVGTLRIETAAENPNYRFDPDIFPESAEARRLDRVLMIPPGPNNPVGVAWIGLNRPGYGIHGTPAPENVGRTESHGCFRLSNWNARFLLRMARKGMPVVIEE